MRKVTTFYGPLDKFGKAIKFGIFVWNSYFSRKEWSAHSTEYN